MGEKSELGKEVCLVINHLRISRLCLTWLHPVLNKQKSSRTIKKKTFWEKSKGTNGGQRSEDQTSLQPRIQGGGNSGVQVK